MAHTKTRKNLYVMNSATVATHEPQTLEEEENCEENCDEARERSPRLDVSERFSITMRFKGI